MEKSEQVKKQSKSKTKTTEETTLEDKSLLLPPEEIANPFMANSNNTSQNPEATETVVEQDAGSTEALEKAQKVNQESTESEQNVANGEDEEGEAPTLQEEIALWKYSAPDELYMLLKEDPNRYLPALEKDRELAQKHGCLVTRENGKLRIKFRIYPEDRWAECGFFEDFDDQVIYQEFSESVQRSLNMPRNRRDPKNMSRKDYLKKVEDNANSSRAHVAAELDQTTADKPTVAAESSENRQTSDDIDREKMLSLKAKQMKHDDLVHEKAVPKPDKVGSEKHRTQKEKKSRNVEATPDRDRDRDRESEPKSELQEEPVIRPSVDSRTGTTLDLGLLLDAYVQQLLERMNGCVRTWLSTSSRRNNQNSYANKGLEQLISNLVAIEQKVPQNLLGDYKNLITNLSAAPTNDFYNFMVDQKQHFLPRHLEPIYDNFLMKIVSSSSLYLGPEFNHTRICQLLGLSEVDVHLLEEHNVDLRELWNNSQVQLH